MRTHWQASILELRLSLIDSDLLGSVHDYCLLRDHYLRLSCYVGVDLLDILRSSVSLWTASLFDIYYLLCASIFCR